MLELRKVSSVQPSLLPMSSDLMETTLAMVSDVNISFNWLLASIQQNILNICQSAMMIWYNPIGWKLFLKLPIALPLLFYLSFDQQINLIYECIWFRFKLRHEKDNEISCKCFIYSKKRRNKHFCFCLLSKSKYNNTKIPVSSEIRLSSRSGRGCVNSEHSSWDD